MSQNMTIFSDFYPMAFVYQTAASFRNGRRIADLVWYERERRSAMRHLLLEEKDLWCCGDCCAEQLSCIICGRETSAAVRACPRAMVVTITDMADIRMIDTACALAAINRLTGGKPLNSSFPGGPTHYVSLV